MGAITVKRNELRGITFLPRQYSAFVPRGEYDHCGQEDVDYSDIGIRCTARAEKLVCRRTGDVWYVGVNVFASHKGLAPR